MANIQLKIKLAAYTKLPLDQYITDLPDVVGDLNLYGRKHGAWVAIRELTLPDDSGLNLIDIDDTHKQISIRQVLTTETPTAFEDDTTYYIIEQTPELFLNGGTAFSNGGNDYVIDSEYFTTYIGGADPVIGLLPINAKGVLLNGN